MRSTIQRQVQAKEWIDIEPRRTATILNVIYRGWEVAWKRDRVQKGTHENELNECLRRGMQEVSKNAANTLPKMIVLEGTQTCSAPDVRTPDGLTDIPICFPNLYESTRNLASIHAIIECKRINGAARTWCRRYVLEGIDRFKSGKYGRRHYYGFMAAYLDSGDANAAVGGINKFLDEQQREDEQLGPGTVSDAEWVRRSQHRRESGDKPIEIHHVFLSFG
ncbi:MAG: hypothetical protein OXU68_13990 [Bacteroidota bacterium]|nr:hypothetical protein [Bacteroidota bacterium]